MSTPEPGRGPASLTHSLGMWEDGGVSQVNLGDAWRRLQGRQPSRVLAQPVPVEEGAWVNPAARHRRATVPWQPPMYLKESISWEKTLHLLLEI